MADRAIVEWADHRGINAAFYLGHGGIPEVMVPMLTKCVERIRISDTYAEMAAANALCLIRAELAPTVALAIVSAKGGSYDDDVWFIYRVDISDEKHPEITWRRYGSTEWHSGASQTTAAQVTP